MKIYHKNGASPVLGELFQESTNQKQQILMSVIESKLHLFQVEHNVAPSNADMTPQFGLGKSPEILYPVNVAAVTVGEHLRVQNQAVAITVSEQPGIAPGSIRMNRAAKRDLLPDNLPQHHQHHIGHWSGVHTPAATSGSQAVRICLAQLGPTDGCGLP
jgi:hypothetical protein